MASVIPTNRAPFSLAEVLVATGGQLVRPGASAEVVGVSTDTRSVAKNNLFVALVGARHDGHDHVADAASRGASALLVSRPVEAPAGVAVVQVDDTLRALGALGRAHRRRWSALAPAPRTLVAITGSAGKTTTRVATAAALASLGLRVHATSGNLNNAVGIPMVLLGLLPEHEAAVVEVGTSSRGEIAHGASVVEPDVAVLTLVAAAHTELIGSVDDVAHEKGFLLAALGASGVAVANADDARAHAQLLRSPARRWLRHGVDPSADVRIVDRVPEGAERSRLALALGPRISAAFRRVELRTPLLGVAGAYAAAAALAAAAAVDPARLDPRRLAEAFEQIEGEGGRLRVVRRPDGTLILDDSYNANGASVAASLRTAAELARAEGRRLVAVLGEMRELGALAPAEHRAVGAAVVAVGASVLVAVQGAAVDIARAAAHALPDALFVPDADRAIEALSARLLPGDLVLVKGSRGVGLDRLVAALAPAPEPSR